MMSLLKNSSGVYPHPSWRRYAPLSGICWKQGRFVRANPHGAMQLSWSGRRTVPCVSAWTSDASMHVLRKIRTPSHKFRRPWRAWWGWHIPHRWISSQAFGRSRWPQDQCTAFTVGNLGFYEFTHMPFGLCNALATFQRLMQNTLGELNLTYCVIYLDDMIVFGRTEEEHLECLHVVFERFRKFNLKVKPSKCSFFQLEIVYLAHHISRRGILPSQENVWAMQEFPMPETYMQVCAFCGLVGHYRRFIKGFANIACPLYDVLGKEAKMGLVDLPPEAWEAVAILKGKVQSAPVLVFPDFEKPFLLEMDASKEGLGAVLSQKQSNRRYHLIAFGSCSLTPAEKNYHSSKLEFFALKWSVTEHFKEYLAYASFVVRTDNNPLTYVLTTPNLDAMGHRWVGALASFQFELEYQKGANNGAADALS